MRRGIVADHGAHPAAHRRLDQRGPGQRLADPGDIAGVEVFETGEDLGLAARRPSRKAEVDPPGRGPGDVATHRQCQRVVGGAQRQGRIGDLKPVIGAGVFDHQVDTLCGDGRTEEMAGVDDHPDERPLLGAVEVLDETLIDLEDIDRELPEMGQ